jgi:A/G-specific adenine glycosylase
LPSPRPKKTLPQRAVQVLLIERAGTILFEKRSPSGIWAGLWSLPEVAVDGDIGVHCRTRFGVAARVVTELPAIEHGFTHYLLTLLPRRVSVRRASVRAEEPGIAWLTPDRALTAALPAPIRKLISAVDRREGSRSGRVNGPPPPGTDASRADPVAEDGRRPDTRREMP